MFGFRKKIPARSHSHDPHVANAAARIPTDPNDESTTPELPAAVRYLPMRRLLSESDEQFIRKFRQPREIRKFRKTRRRAYLDYLSDLKLESRHARSLRLEAATFDGGKMLSLILNETLRSEKAFLHLRWLAVRHALHLDVRTEDVTSYVQLLLDEPTSLPAIA